MPNYEPPSLLAPKSADLTDEHLKQSIMAGACTQFTINADTLYENLNLFCLQVCEESKTFSAFISTDSEGGDMVGKPLFKGQTFFGPITTVQCDGYCVGYSYKPQGA